MFGKIIKEFQVNTKNQKALISITYYNNGIYMANANFNENNVGFVLYDIANQTCVIKNIFVYPEYRREGVGTQLLKVVELTARKNKCNKIVGSFLPQIMEKEATSFYSGSEDYKIQTLNKNKYKFSIIKFKDKFLIYKKLTEKNESKPNFISEINI